MPEFAFDSKLWAVVRVTANSEQEAREKVCKAVQAASINWSCGDVRITEGSIEDPYEDQLFEIDGESVEN